MRKGRASTNNMFSLGRCSLLGAALASFLAYIGALLPTPPEPTDPDVAALDKRFSQALAGQRNAGLSIGSKGFLLRDRDTLFWKLFTDKFGANPNTPVPAPRPNTELCPQPLR